jgi:hypothetical protein
MNCRALLRWTAESLPGAKSKGRLSHLIQAADYSMLAPSGWYLYFLPSQKITEVI